MPIRQSVGSGGANLRGDVYYVQFLLCDYRCRNFIPPIKVDGIVGPETIGAIRAAQQDFAGTVDARIDPKGPTITALERAHLAGVTDIQFNPEVKQYLKSNVPVNFMLQRVYAVYLNKLRESMGEDSPQKQPPSVSAQV
jgi:peptidoglycan hydrolase-like protein with peptidoglycan-binding domain